MTAAAPAASASTPDLAFIWTRFRSFLRGMIGIEIGMPALLIVVGGILVVASSDSVVRSFGLAVLLPGIGMAIGSLIRIIGLVGAQGAFLGAGRQAGLRRGRRLAMVGLAAGVLAAIVSLAVVASISWMDDGAGFIAILVVFFALLVTLGLSLSEFRAEGTAAKATAAIA